VGGFVVSELFLVFGVGVTPDWFIVMKAMMGDSDNIPGCASGFGWSAAKLLIDEARRRGIRPDSFHINENGIMALADVADGADQWAPSRMAWRVKKFDRDAVPTLARNIKLMDFRHSGFSEEEKSKIQEQMDVPLNFDRLGITEIFRKHELKSLVDLISKPTFQRLI
jgi:5'-3' exonuclease